MLHAGLKAQGFQLGTETPQSAIIAVIMPDLERGAAMWEALLREGLYVNLARPPATPANMTLLRCSLCAEHTAEQVQAIWACSSGRVRRWGSSGSALDLRHSFSRNCRGSPCRHRPAPFMPSPMPPDRRPWPSASNLADYFDEFRGRRLEFLGLGPDRLQRIGLDAVAGPLPAGNHVSTLGARALIRLPPPESWRDRARLP